MGRKCCIAVMVLNIFLLFYSFGMPKVYENKHHFTVHLVGLHFAGVVRLNSDAVIVDADGNEYTYESGRELSVHHYSEEDGTPWIWIPSSTDIMNSVPLTGADYEDITAEKRAYIEAENKKIDEEGPHKYRVYRLKNLFWFVIPEPQYLACYIVGLPAGLLTFFIEKKRYKKAVSSDRLVRFFVTDVIIAVAVLTLTVLYLMNPITCR